METRFTKGEWKCEFTRNDDSTEYYLANTDGIKTSYSEAQANATLIESAPELLEALESAQRLLLMSNDYLNSEEYTLITNAIKKAKGE